MTKDKPDVATSFHRIIKHIAYMPKKKNRTNPLFTFQVLSDTMKCLFQFHMPAYQGC